MIFVQLLIMFIAAVLNGVEPAEMTFQQLNHGKAISLHLQEVVVKGFLHNTPGGGLILAPQADLKTCCAGSKDNIDQQIYLLSKQSVDMQTGIAQVRGLFFYDPTWDADGQVVAVYKIFDAQISTAVFPWPIGTIVLVGLLVTGLICCAVAKLRNRVVLKM